MKTTGASQEDITAREKLQARLAANSLASRDFDEWCLRQFPELPLPAQVLDLGCGTGKQVLLFGPLLSPRSHIWGIDLSQQSLQTLKAQYRAAASLHLIAGSFDQLDLHHKLRSGQFDLIYSSYSLYYTQNLPHLLAEVFRLLRPGGIFWVIAPYRGTNQEFLPILRRQHEVEPFMDYVFEQFHQEVISLGEEVGFSSLKPSLLRNKITFPSAEAFMHYLKNSLFYRPGHDEAIGKEVEAVVKAQGAFSVSKHIISLQLRK
ncbi:MAG: class I SAM-dependent methyltransferase [Bacteroidetes bacterium]|nr:MAG: class I SAM-dependent methyltransferase [Bacteroidota bacterium]